MDLDSARALLGNTPKKGFDVYERRPGDYQLIVPILHEDGDMVDIYLQESPRGEGYVRVCDFGLTLMRLSYTFDAASATRRRILASILTNNGVQDENGNLFLDAPIHLLYECILQFAGCVQKICNMRYWNVETVRTAFYDDLEEYVTTQLKQFSPFPNEAPLPDQPIFNVDWSLTLNSRSLYLFGVQGNNKAKNVAICLLEFQKAQLPFISIVVHKDMEELGKRESLYLTRNADTQYPVLDDFRERAVEDIYRLAA